MLKMRVHLRGVVIGVGVVLSVVVIVAVFNAYDTPTDTKRGRYSTGVDSDEDSPSRSSPRSSTRLRAGGGGARAGGAGGPRAGGGPGGARAGGGAGGARAGGGGPGARAGGAGARAGGAAGGARAKAAAAQRSEEEDDFDLDAMETLTDDSEEFPISAPKGRKAGGGNGGKGAAAQRAAAAAASREKTKVGGGVFDDDEEPEPVPKKTPKRKKGGKSAAKSAEKEEEKKKEESEEKKEEEEEEERKKEKKHKKKQLPYPEWWKAAIVRSGVVEVQGQLVGDKPLFAECPTFQEVGSPKEKVKRYGHIERPNFLGNSKNPCWFEFNGKKDILKCVPYFYIGGVPKAGVGDLFNRMSAHPAILTGDITEYHWWDRGRYGATLHPKYTKEWRRTNDPIPMKDYSKQVVGTHGKNMTKAVLYYGRCESLIGDGSPTYLVENTQWDVFEGNEGCSEPRIIPASFMYHVFPDARFIFILRDPIERLYARFLAYVPYVEEYENHTASLFHTFTVQAVENYRNCFSKTSIRQCAYNTSLYTNSVIRLSEGMYSIFLQDWFRIFPREQILIFKFEEYINDIKGHVQQSFKHLGLDPLSEYSMLKVEEMPVIRKGKTPEQEGYLMPETIALLKEFYEPFNMHLSEVLDDEKWLFPREDPVQPAPLHVDVEEEGNNDLQAAGQPAHDESAAAAAAEAPAAEQPVAAAGEGGGGGVDVVSADGGVGAAASAGSAEGGGGGVSSEDDADLGLPGERGGEKGEDEDGVDL